MLREDGLSKPPFFSWRNKRKQCIRMVLIETTTWAKCQRQLADAVVGEERGNLLFHGLSLVLGFCSCCLSRRMSSKYTGKGGEWIRTCKRRWKRKKNSSSYLNTNLLKLTVKCDADFSRNRGSSRYGFHSESCVSENTPHVSDGGKTTFYHKSWNSL